MSSSKTGFGVYVGRFNPIHLGHQRTIEHMLAESGPKNCLIIIGSSNAPTSLRHFFSYHTRRDFITQLYPDVPVVGLPDYHSDTDWLIALDDLIRLSGHEPADVTFYGGSTEDVRFFVDDGRRIDITNRFDGSSVKVSATEVRDALVHGRSLAGMVDPQIATLLMEKFGAQWELFSKQ